MILQLASAESESALVTYLLELVRCQAATESHVQLLLTCIADNDAALQTLMSLVREDPSRLPSNASFTELMQRLRQQTGHESFANELANSLAETSSVGSQDPSASAASEVIQRLLSSDMILDSRTAERYLEVISRQFTGIVDATGEADVVTALVALTPHLSSAEEVVALLDTPTRVACLRSYLEMLLRRSPSKKTALMLLSMLLEDYRTVPDQKQARAIKEEALIAFLQQWVVAGPEDLRLSALSSVSRAGFTRGVSYLLEGEADRCDMIEYLFKQNSLAGLQALVNDNRDLCVLKCRRALECAISITLADSGDSELAIRWSPVQTMITQVLCRELLTPYQVSTMHYI